MCQYQNETMFLPSKKKKNNIKLCYDTACEYGTKPIIRGSVLEISLLQTDLQRNTIN